jgi:hypothetical protein
VTDVRNIEYGRLYLQALRNARRRQLAARALRPINRRRTRASPLPGAFRPVEGPVRLWRSAAFSGADKVAERLPDGELDVLGLTVSYPLEHGHSGLERLRRFHLHYGDEILGCARQGEPRYLEAARAGLRAWIRSNPPATMESWHPYPASTRIGNWIAAASLDPGLATPEVTDSLWRQLAYLERNVEDDVLGNHIIRNARALILGGIAFDSKRLLSRGLELLARELPEQILSDGGHYERSPVYHSLVLRDLLEIRAALGSSELDETIDRMEEFAVWLSRPDGRPALFNDGGLDLAPDLRDQLQPPQSGFRVFEQTGYAVVRNGSALWLAFDCGAAAPPFLPPHAHADALSFQVWVDGQAIIIDPGTFTYEPGVERDWFRSTRAHSTVSVDGDQFRFVGPFRAVDIPTVRIMNAAGNEREGAISAEFIGFRQSGGAKHRRRLGWSERELRIEDEIEGQGARLLESALPLSAAVDVEQRSVLRAGGVTIESWGPLDVSVEERCVAERFFERKRARAVVAKGEATLPARFGWRLRFPQSRSRVR